MCLCWWCSCLFTASRRPRNHSIHSASHMPIIHRYIYTYIYNCALSCRLEPTYTLDSANKQQSSRASHMNSPNVCIYHVRMSTPGYAIYDRTANTFGRVACGRHTSTIHTSERNWRKMTSQWQRERERVRASCLALRRRAHPQFALICSHIPLTF